ncbi:hypothetical protein Clow_01613 [Corynebacterium lowii]|uniref:Uncharacterized protein n=1 Tax=Corynebacterium lowii TaxID=1544413 RepID=A0A0Q0UGY5_9CORY|nr:hypothetical protein Clow_01613 [Corynebacterium lowii]MDP9850700.1 hypothetical protein [Corynebacterium lowii]
MTTNTPQHQEPSRKQRLPWIIGALMLAMLMSSLAR